jgi:hypothetical protein
LSETTSITNTDNTFKSTFANLSDTNCSMLTELEQKLQEEIGENVVLVAYRC